MPEISDKILRYAKRPIEGLGLAGLLLGASASSLLSQKPSVAPNQPAKEVQPKQSAEDAQMLADAIAKYGKRGPVAYGSGAAHIFTIYTDNFTIEGINYAVRLFDYHAAPDSSTLSIIIHPVKSNEPNSIWIMNDVGIRGISSDAGIGILAADSAITAATPPIEKSKSDSIYRSVVPVLLKHYKNK